MRMQQGLLYGKNRFPKLGMQRSSIVHGFFVAAALLSTGASYRTQNFLVTADEVETAETIAFAAERQRWLLSEKWLGEELPPWSDPCIVRVVEDVHLPAQGQTSFIFVRGRPRDWRMSLQGPRQKLLQSVLPHEIAHTIFATHFGRPLPRWLEEGICVFGEDLSSRALLQQTVIATLRRGNAISPERLFQMKAHPRDIMQVYSQGYSLTRFLVSHGGESKLMQFIADGLDSGDWSDAARKHYGYESLPDLHRSWMHWVLLTDV